MKKAKFLSKLSKFENIEKSSEEKPSKAEVAKKTKMFESGMICSFEKCYSEVSQKNKYWRFSVIYRRCLKNSYVTI